MKTHLEYFTLPPAIIERLPLLVLMLVLEVLPERFQAGTVVSAHAVQIVDLLGAEVHDAETPVHAEVDWEDHQVVREYIHLEMGYV